MPAAARFHGIRDRVVAAVDQIFAEPMRIYPMKQGKTDPDRAVFEIEAVLRVGEGKETTAGGGQSIAWRSRLEAGKGELHINRATYSGPRLLYGDRVAAISRIGEPLFDVIAVDDRSHTRLVLELGEAKG